MPRRRSKIATEGVGEATRPGRKRRGRFAKLVFLGGIVAFVTRPQVRGKALDVVFGPEEQFDYESVTEPIVHEIQPEDAETAWPGATAAPPPADDDDAPAWRLTTTPITGHNAPAVDVAGEEEEDAPATSPWTPPEPSEAQAEPAGESDGPSWQYSAPEEPPSSAPEPESDPEPEALETTAPPSSTWPPADTATSPDRPSTPWTASSSEPSSESEPESEPPHAPWSRPSDAFESPAEPPEYRAAPVEPEEPTASAEPEPPASPEEPTASAEPEPSVSPEEPTASAEPDAAAVSHRPADAAQAVPEHAWGVPASESPGVTHTPVPPADEPPSKPAYQRLIGQPPPGEPTRPAIGEATPPRSGWWLPRRRREDSEPPQWDWRSE
jgi:hypothetical protein